MWLRLGVQTDFSLTNTTGIRADIVPGAVSVEQMYNLFPFDNSITKMQLSGKEVTGAVRLRRAPLVWAVAALRRCRSRARASCSTAPWWMTPTTLSRERRSNLYIGVTPGQPEDLQRPTRDCPSSDLGSKRLTSKGATPRSACARTTPAGCPPGATQLGSCDLNTPAFVGSRSSAVASYELATSNYLAGGGSGFRVLQRNTTQFDTQDPAARCPHRLHSKPVTGRAPPNNAREL